ncbi:hypothetical protein QUF65_01845 [Lysinibacillus sphaericus]|uniref:hypothetical protein n=1 Tax=Lysinibacillus sphaericus TaxID=1421 RepID=UPI0025A196E9|nr:hypothetical protein [Lysinibacillus sphaericus]MDM5349629.1 hypothetical protein [Lysinibacillus sphaericus]
MKKWSTYIWKLIWVIGLFLLTIISYDIKYQIKVISATTYSIVPVFLANFITLFMWGVYLSLIFIKKWTIKINLPLLICVFIPCFLFSLYVPLATFLPLTLPIGGIWFNKAISSNFIGIVAGLTFMLSIFNDSRSKNE